MSIPAPVLITLVTMVACVLLARGGRPLAVRADGDGALLHSAPVPLITALATSGQAPCTIHVHALDSPIGGADPLDVRYEWDFGDPAGAYNRLEGWNGAHVYDAPGRYVITLRMTNAHGASATAEYEVRVTPDSRSRLWVAAEGSDRATGRSPDSPLRTLARAQALATDDTAILLKRGDVFEVDRSIVLASANCLIAAWGEGERPTLRWTGPPGHGAILALDPASCRDVVIEDLRFDSLDDDPRRRNVAVAIHPAGRNVTVRRCALENLTDAINANRRPVGLLSIDNTAHGLRAYYLWGEGSDHVHLGNTVDGSLHEHAMRFAGVERALVAKCDLACSPKRTIWAMSGQFVWIASNVLREGRLTAGPSEAAGRPETRLRWCVIERNEIAPTSARMAAVEVNAGAEHVMIRSNVIATSGNASIRLMGFDEKARRTCRDVRVLANTGVLDGTRGRFLDRRAGAESVRVEGNLFVAPHLRADEQTESVADVALDERFRPPAGSAAFSGAEPVLGVFTDFHGRERPRTGRWTAGAVEVAPERAQ